MAEGVIFDDGTGAFTWLTPIKTVTTFWKISEVKKLHGHEGKTEVIIEGRDKRFGACKEAVRLKKSDEKRKKREQEDEQ